MPNADPPVRIPIRECLICENRSESRIGCYLCRGLGFIHLRTFNEYKLGHITRGQWLGSSDADASSPHADWIAVKFIGGPHHGAQLSWPADDPPEVGQELSFPVDADLRTERRPSQEALFRDYVTYVVDRRPSGFCAVYRAAKG